MRHLRLTQGSPEWLAHRRTTRNASDAPAVLDCSPYKKRSELVREIATGIGQEFSPEQQAILNSGHIFEALARPLADAIVGEELYPVVGVHDDGVYGASFDGLTMLEETALEHKRLNAALREAMVPGCTGVDLPLCYQVQMEHQAMVCPTIERILFMASEWRLNGDTGEWELVEERHCWYTPNPELRAKIVAGWELLEKDVAAYTPPKAEAVADKIHAALPVLRIEATGTITASTLDEFQVVVLDRINAVNLELETDQHFADGSADAAWLRDVSAKMKEAVQRVRSGMQTVDDVLRVLEKLDELATDKALKLEKKVKTEKEARKEKIVLAGEKALADHITSLNEKLGASYIPLPRGIFAPVVKGLKSLASMEDKVKAALAGATAEADATAARLAANRAHLQHDDQDWITLFPDFAGVGTKAAEDFHALAALRIGNHKQAEADRLQRIRDEDAARLAKQQEEEQAKAAAAPAPPAQAAIKSGLPFDPAAAQAHIPDTRVLPGGGLAHVPVLAAQEAEDTSTITLGQVKTRISPLSIDAAALEYFSIPFKRERGAVHITESDFRRLVTKMVSHLADQQNIVYVE